MEDFTNENILAMTFINGKPAPWSPFGVEPNPRDFRRRETPFVFYSEDERTFCEVATRKYMRFKMPRLDGSTTKWKHCDGSITEYPNEVRAVFAAGIGEGETDTLIKQGLPIVNPEGVHFYINGHSDEIKTTYLCYQELTLEDLHVMKNGIDTLIEYLEKKTTT